LEILFVVVVFAVVIGVMERAVHSSRDFVAPPPPPLAENMPYLTACLACGKMIANTAAACPECGHPRHPPVAAPRKSRGAATALALLLGGIGLHKFYLDQPGQGILYLVFCWTFIPALIGLIEGLSYATSSDESFHAKYG